MSILEETRNTDVDRLAKAQRLITDIQNEQSLRETIAQIIDNCLDGMKPRYYHVGWRWEFRFETVGQAREFTSRVLERLEVDKAEKVFEGYGSQPVWKYVVRYQGQTIKVEPADADENCQPVPRVSASTYWVCEKETDKSTEEK